MGRPLRTQKRGKGSRRYTNNSKNLKPILTYRELTLIPEEQRIITQFEHRPGKCGPIGKIGKDLYILVPAGAEKGQKILLDKNHLEEKHINITALMHFPIGAEVCAIEKRIDQGPTFLKATGTYGIIVEKNQTEVKVKFIKSKFIKTFARTARAMHGRIAGGGRLLKPLLKAGASKMKLKNRSRKNVHVRGVAMNRVDHPFGGGDKQGVGKFSSLPYGVSPGRKVGHYGKKPKRLKKYFK
jgi:large subunit ribosomal protein L2